MTKWMIALAMTVLSVHAGASGDLTGKVWNHGSQDCRSNHDPAIEIFKFDEDTFILRQNKCVHFEAPFIYLLFGDHTVFVQDTGATADADLFPLYDAVQNLVAQRTRLPADERLKILVTHSHSHSDHTAADSQFRGRPGVTLIEPNAEAVREYFGFVDWPRGTATIDLGGRTLVVLPALGHQDEGIAVYDPRTGWLLTGDNLYPGRLYVKNWNEYTSTIGRLAEFTKTHRISAVMGTHIEISSAGKLFPIGSTFQPDEANLALTVEDLLALNEILQKGDERPKEIVTAKFVVTPIGAFQRVLGGMLKWIGVR